MNNISQLKEHDFFGNHIAYRTSDQWGEIVVIDRGNLKVLNFDPVYDQTCIYIKYPHIPVHEYIRVMLLVLTFITPRHITILGLGGGSLLHSLHYLLPECNLLCVELRQKVYDVAINFFQLPVRKNIKIMITDAQSAIKYQESGSTQVLFADIYLSYGMDSFQIQKQFIEECYRVLDDTGWLVVNYHELPDVNSAFMQCLHHYFVEIIFCGTVSGNYILFASKSPIKELNASCYQTTIFELETKLNIKLLHLFKRFKQFKIAYVEGDPC